MFNKKIFIRANQILLDILIFGFSFFAAYFIRFEGLPQGWFLKQLMILIPYIVTARFLLFSVFKVYSIVWRYISISDSLTIIKTNSILTVLLLLGRTFFPSKLMILRIPYSVIVIELLLTILGTLGIRMMRRLIIEYRIRGELENGNKKDLRRTFLVGAGNAGNLVWKELKQRPDLGYKVVGFIDDDTKKHRAVIQGLKVVGSTSQIKELARANNVDTAIITIANASSADIRRIKNRCDRAGVKVKIIPGILELLDDKIKINKIRDVNIDDLLGRSVVQFKNDILEISKTYQEKRILVTGAGGSIGSELCRQLALFWPKQLVLLDKDENGIFEIHNELRREYDNIRIYPVIGDVRDHDRLKRIFQRFRSQVVFHAAAHKHVPLMEYNITEAVTNNVIGTKNMAEVADEFGVLTFINISTDKAVNPTSVMGATKRIGEMVIQHVASQSKSKFSCVRFGNVLGSSGSVVSVFQKQIADGGPITITHPKIERFFMSLSEAVQLIIKAGCLGNKGDIFILDMGTPVKIVDLARDLVRLSGFRENEIDFKYIGLRPGEKLYEEMLIDKERDKSTNFQKIFRSPPIPIEYNDFKRCLDIIISNALQCDGKGVIECFKRMKIGYDGEKALI
jgi:FlaA1/EpsC-like NDP-sugar epimerase